ncbi:WGR domain-containing protein [Planktotalea sp.]|jgi:predicted DNA-binding WGR domain protein|uniref:WGR domain-containing protein n=1 Tax=Planktotalea sp. TaxID=2029877 RepID=UPI003F6D7098
MQIDMKRVDPELNMDRFYCVELTKDLFGDHGIHRQWGRSGSWGRIRNDWFDTKQEAQRAMSKLINDKVTRGYAINPPFSE